MDWKNQYSKNEYTTQSNLYIQCNPYQATNNIFHRIRKNNFTICMEIQWQPTPVLLPGKSHGWRSLVGCSPWGRTRLSEFTFSFHLLALEKETAIHSSVPAWRTPGMGEPGGLPSMRSHRVGHD